MSTPSPTVAVHEHKATIKSVDMSEEMQQVAVDTAIAALAKYEHEKDHEKDAAMYIKKEFDRLYNTTWHCVVGKNFGSFVTHETKNFIYFYLGPTVAILLWKTS
ncbi:Dynein light chain [Apiotrichum porosum]|uniref:Dynein light chain n=1 Tax=Apiotrichum porosum TaxID=105984 RepID=A0A427Y6D1_9TREE|nr:Dynein light chain [Apiotrichum porosum]RSH86648.1 Dynein light chain [Apiotrichum porosum]